MYEEWSPIRGFSLRVKWAAIKQRQAIASEELKRCRSKKLMYDDDSVTSFMSQMQLACTKDSGQLSCRPEVHSIIAV